MSNALAIGSVTAVLKDLLDTGLKIQKVGDIVGGDVTISTLPPDRIDISGDEDPTLLNLFLYQTTFNQGWRNMGLPTRNSNGDRVDDNPLALNLHYLLSAYGAKNFYSEIILGYAMQLLHENPIVTRDAIRKALNPNPKPPDWPDILATSELANQVEQLRIVPEIFNTEEISKLWNAIQGHYRTTAAYQVTVVLIDSSRPTKKALPVADRNTYVVTLNEPVIESVSDSASDTAPITPLSTLIITGNNLRGAEDTQVLISGFDLSANITDLHTTEIKLSLPDPLPPGMYAGVQIVQVVQPKPMGTPPVDHAGFESNVEAIVLRPIVTPQAPVNVTDRVVDGVTVRSGDITINFKPNVGIDQRVVLLLNELNAPPNRSPFAYTFKAPPGNGIVDPNTETSSATISFQDVVPADYLVRVQVDGAESLLAIDGGTGKYATPKVTI